MQITILDDYQDSVRHLAAFRKLAGHSVRVYHDSTTDEDELARRLQDTEAVVLIRERTRLTPTLLDRLPQLRLVSQTGKVAGHLSVADCTARGIAVAEGTGSPYSTAELTWALILAAMRHIPQEVAHLKAGGWQHTLGRQLRGRRLGVWSYGKIGQLVAGYGRAFGMRVWVWGREGSVTAARADGFEAAPSREAFFAESDVVSLHIRLTPDTHGLISAADLALMQPEALFVNTSRAELVEAGALVAALQWGRPGLAAVDVYEQEPVLGATHPLLALPNAVCTPHLGYVEKDNYELYFGQAFDNILAFAAGQPTHIANPQVL
ncbi:D-2-hydroxyacid dehydrogenase family protein [Hymenobacter cellulosivorans]|uniref:D-2-hydroxyacid dehydrogenase family protein n=1 Tax=Hymenobacter cellulosivorans TaxID=2932249 RepID=A0ABY4FEY6_9BACT|nr:D-2-hydroxyacid dehydrogenase family protein [Hymenobacter cellulosivorans]UOQ55237.1 D-2-hydroxyacid dehydrogenase family protein [Hymenobacter cellulosivorans]